METIVSSNVHRFSVKNYCLKQCSLLLRYNLIHPLIPYIHLHTLPKCAYIISTEDGEHEILTLFLYKLLVSPAVISPSGPAVFRTGPSGTSLSWLDFSFIDFRLPPDCCPPAGELVSWKEVDKAVGVCSRCKGNNGIWYGSKIKRSLEKENKNLI